MKTILLTALLFFGLSVVLCAQGPLDRTVSIHVQGQTLTKTLQELGRLGGFYFSYNTNILPGDSLVHLSGDKRTIRSLLDSLLKGRYEYIESGRYIILQRKRAGVLAMPLSGSYTFSGYVLDADTKKSVGKVSVYIGDQLVSALTDSTGYFKLRLKDRGGHILVSVSAALYRDTFLVIRSGYDQEYTFYIESARVAELMPFVVSSRVEKTWLGRVFLSSRLKIQSLNLLNFFADKPLQMSLTPGLGTHGQMGGQVINKFSLNILGGYTAGSNGLELAGLFNIDKRDVHYVQAAGLFNTVGGVTGGVQLAGIMNNDLDSVKGVQAAGIVNRVNGSLDGVQLAGIANAVSGTVRGVQAAGVVNRAGHLKGVQIGIVNIADTCSGLMIGLVNLTKHGYHAFSIGSDEALPVRVAYKSGGRILYSILAAGANPVQGSRLFMLGYGVGARTTGLGRFSLAAELTAEDFYTGNWTDIPMLYRLQPQLQYRLSRHWGIYAGPAFSICDAAHAVPSPGYKMPARDGFSVGWAAGINFF